MKGFKEFVFSERMIYCWLLNKACILLYILEETNAQIARMSEELMRKDEELIHYQEEISSLLSQIVDLQHKIKEVDVHKVQRREMVKVKPLLVVRS